MNISGASEIKESSWNITLDVKSKYTSTGYFGKQVPTVDGHRIKMYDITANKPGDYAEIYIIAHNGGTLMAELTDIIVGAPTCTSETGNNADAELVCNSLSYS